MPVRDDSPYKNSAITQFVEGFSGNQAAQGPNYRMVAPAKANPEPRKTSAQRGRTRGPQVESAPYAIPTRKFTNRRTGQTSVGPDIDAAAADFFDRATTGGAPAGGRPARAREFSAQRRAAAPVVAGATALSLPGANNAPVENPTQISDPNYRGPGSIVPQSKPGDVSRPVTNPSGSTTRFIPDRNQARSALDAVGAGQGALYGEQSQLLFSGDDNIGFKPLGNVNPETGETYENEAGRAVNAIRQQTLDDEIARSPLGRTGQQIFTINDSRQSIDDQRRDIIDAMGRSPRNDDFNRMVRQLDALDSLGRESVMRDQAELYAGSRSAVDPTDIARLQLDQANSQARIQRDQQAAQLDEAQFLRLGREEQVGLFEELLKAGIEQQANGQSDAYRQTLQLLGSLGDELGGTYGDLSQRLALGMANGGVVPEAYAMGGMIPEMGAMEMYAGGGMIQPSDMPPPAIMQQYQQYADGARQMGLTAVPFDEFAALQGSTGQTIQGFAEGGMVDNDASGKMVVDTDPQAPTDSIPAMIDGQRPAALDSGEFVIPKDVVMFYGTDKLDKMIEKARNPQGGKANGAGQSDTALGLGLSPAV